MDQSISRMPGKRKSSDAAFPGGDHTSGESHIHDVVRRNSSGSQGGLQEYQRNPDPVSIGSVTDQQYIEALERNRPDLGQGTQGHLSISSEIQQNNETAPEAEISLIDTPRERSLQEIQEHVERLYQYQNAADTRQREADDMKQALFNLITGTDIDTNIRYQNYEGMQWVICYLNARTAKEISATKKLTEAMAPFFSEGSTSLLEEKLPQDQEHLPETLKAAAQDVDEKYDRLRYILYWLKKATETSQTIADDCQKNANKIKEGFEQQKGYKLRRDTVYVHPSEWVADNWGIDPGPTLEVCDEILREVFLNRANPPEPDPEEGGGRSIEERAVANRQAANQNREYLQLLRNQH